MVRKHTRRVRYNRCNRRNRRQTRKSGGGIFNIFRKKEEPQQLTFTRAKPEDIAIGIRNNDPMTVNEVPSRRNSTVSEPGNVRPKSPVHPNNIRMLEQRYRKNKESL